MMGVHSLAETLVSVYQTTRRNVPVFRTISTYTVRTPQVPYWCKCSHVHFSVFLGSVTVQPGTY